MPDDMEVDADSATQSQPCAQCAEPIDGDELVVECFGKCRLTIHASCLPGTTTDQVKQLKHIHNAVFVCDACLALHEYDEEHCKKSLDEIVKKLNDFACVVDFVKNFEEKVKSVVRSELVQNNMCSTVAAVEKEDGASTEPRRVLRSTLARKRKLEAAAANGSNGDETPKSKLSFAEVTKKRRTKKLVPEQGANGEKQHKKPNPVLVIKPKEGVLIDDAKAELKKKVNPKNMNVSRVVQNKNGAVMVVLKDEASSQLMKENVEKAMGDQFEVTVKESIKPTVKIIGMSEELNEEELKTTLVDQNEAFQSLAYFKLRKFYSNPRWKYSQYCAIVELDAATFHKVMEQEKLNVGWDRCRVFDGVDVMRCYKCCGFNHKSADCTAKDSICPICSGDHPVKSCDSKEEKCANCEKYRKERKLDIDVDHAAWSTECPVYLMLKERRNKQIDFTT